MTRIEDICALVGLQLGIKKVNPGDHLREQLGAESLDVQNIIMALEDKYKITIGDNDVAEIETVTDFHKLVSAKV